MEENNLASFGESNQLTNNEMTGIYNALSVTDNSDIDIIDDLQFVQESIEILFDKNFRMIDKDVLQGNTLLLNQKFVELVKYCGEKKFKKVGYIFIGFCDYFDLDGSKVYSNLHEKLQRLIQYSAKCLCGVKTYEKIKQKNSEHPNLHIPTLFDLIKK